MDKTADSMKTLQTLLDRCSIEAERQAPDNFLISHYLDQCQQLSDQLGHKLNTTQWFESGVHRVPDQRPTKHKSAWKMRCEVSGSFDFFIAWLRAEKGILDRKRSH